VAQDDKAEKHFDVANVDAEEKEPAAAAAGGGRRATARVDSAVTAGTKECFYTAFVQQERRKNGAIISSYLSYRCS
jgi:hypothetical protein